MFLVCNAMQDAFMLVNLNINILLQAARLRNYMYYPKVMQATEKKRVLTELQAKHLAAYQQDEASAKKLLMVGAKSADARVTTEGLLGLFARE